MKHFDKLLHFIVGLVIFIITGTMVSTFAALVIAAVVAAMKEIRDLMTGNGTPEWLDFHATMLGGFVGWLILSLVQTTI